MAGVEQWLGDIGLGRYAELFAENDIDFDILPDLTEQDLAQLGISLGHRKRLLRAIASLAGGGPPVPGAAPAAAPAPAQPRAPRRDAERRQLTVMFCDMVGSTALSTRLDPEDLREVIRRYQESCAAVVARFDGYIGNYIGDGILVYFGYPRAHEDDPQRAIKAGMEIVDAIHKLNAEVAIPGVDVAVRVGINTGLVVAGDIGTGEFRDEMAVVGETPNVAARLQALAEPGTVAVGENTRRLVEGLFLFDDLGREAVKGVSAPVAVFRVREESGAPSRFEATAIRGLTPLVAREEELGLLMSRWRHARAGEGQVVLLTGEPGIGKSRTIQSLRDRLRQEAVTVLRYYCSPFYVHSALHPVLDQLERAAGLKKSDSAATKLDKLEAVLSRGTGKVTEATALIAPLLSIPTGERYPRLDLTPERQKERTLEALLEQLSGLAAQPMLLILEDAHWIDPTSAEMFKIVVDRVQRMPVLLLIAFRPDFTPPWTGYPHVTSLSLSRLTHAEAAALATRVTGGRALPDEIVAQIVARTDGVPLFVEELTKTILESGVLLETNGELIASGPIPALSIPESLQDSLMARLDRLAPVKEVAQLASTLGRVVSHELLAAVSNLDEAALDHALAQLVDAELIYRRGAPPEVIYEFKHALVQDAAYNSLLRTRRHQIHRKIGETLETQFPDVVEGKPELLAHHFREAGDTARAIPYALRAGDAAAARYASIEARARYREALEMTHALPASDAVQRARIDASLKLASVAQNRQHYEEDLKNLEQALEIANEIKDEESLCRIRYWIGRTNYVFGRFDQAVDYGQGALRLGEMLGGHDQFTADPVNLLGRVHCLRGEARKAIDYAARNVDQMRRLGNGIEEAAMSGVLAFAYGLHGDFPQAFEAATHGIGLARQLEHLPTQAACVFFHGVVRGWRGDIDVAVPEFEETLALCQKTGDVFRAYLTHGWRGQAYLVVEQRAEAEEDLRLCLKLGNEIGTSFHRGAFQAFLAKIQLLNGDAPLALDTASEALKVATDTNQGWSRSIALRVQAETLVETRQPDFDEADRAVRAAIEIQEARESRFDLAWSHLALGLVGAARGDRQRAEQALAAAGALFDSMGVIPGQDRVRAAIGEVAEA